MQQAVDTSMQDKVEEILSHFNYDKGMLVSILQDVQAEYRYLPREALERVSKVLLVPLSQVYGVATFFKAFSLKPRGRHLINVCVGTACHVRGAVRVLEGVERELGLSAGETTADLRFTLETVNCVGACALGPVVIVDGEYHGQMKSEKVKDMLAKYS
jgi:NADH-quinone oxidoreductase subunit E